MKTLLIVLAGAVLMVRTAPAQTTPPQASGSAAPAKPAPKAKGKAKTKAAAAAVQPVVIPPIVIPKDAVKDGNRYHWVDPQGKAWTFAETPFGVKKTADAAVPAPAATPESAPAPAPKPVNSAVSAVADGDTIKFSKSTPFGVTSWSKNKNALTAEEQQIWDREQAKRNQ